MQVDDGTPGPGGKSSEREKLAVIKTVLLTDCMQHQSVCEPDSRVLPCTDCQPSNQHYSSPLRCVTSSTSGSVLIHANHSHRLVSVRDSVFICILRLTSIRTRPANVSALFADRYTCLSRGCLLQHTERTDIQCSVKVCLHGVHPKRPQSKTATD